MGMLLKRNSYLDIYPLPEDHPVYVLKFTRHPRPHTSADSSRVFHVIFVYIRFHNGQSRSQ